jgi:uncharacterized protein (DUF58 family)
VIFALLLLAAWFGQTAIVVTLGLLLAAVGISRLWSRLSLSAVSCERSLSDKRVFPGDTVELGLKLVNRKLLPLPWIQVEDEIPADFDASGSLPKGERPGAVVLGRTASLLWYTSVSWKQRLDCSRRGYYRFGPVRVTSGDFFGFYPRSITLLMEEHVVVYPRIFPLAGLEIDSLQPVGEVTADRRIFEDPVRLAGVREYTPHDSRRRIHWKASARHQNLQVKVFEPTTSLKVAIFLAVDSFTSGTPQRREELELGISMAASVASHLIEQRSAVGLFVNSRLVDSGQAVSLFPGSSTEHLIAMLEALARVTPGTSVPFEQFIQPELGRLPWGTTSLCIVSRSHSRLIELLTAMQQGQKIRVMPVGGGEPGVREATVGQETARKERTVAPVGGEA